MALRRKWVKARSALRPEKASFLTETDSTGGRAQTFVSERYRRRHFARQEK